MRIQTKTGCGKTQQFVEAVLNTDGDREDFATNQSREE